MSSTASGSGNSSRYLDFDEYVDLKLQQTRSSIKTTDILVALAGVAAMFLSYLLVFVIFDQWVVTGGFSIGVRWLLLSTLLLLTATWLAWKVGLPYFRTVNRLFAAREIEKADAELKSNLLNLVDLRSSGREVNPAILRALEKNAAVGLQNVDVAQAIDHRPLMRIAYVLLAVVAVFCLYALLSPKKISNSIWRSLLPAADLRVATQTEIVKVDPGDTTIQARETVLFIADIAGDVPQKVFLHYTSADGKFRDEPLELRTDTEGPTRFKGSLPNVIQDLTYVVRAGDASSREYHITVNQPPSATVDRTRYQFPAYMKLDETEQAGGLIDSWEGTKVHLTARTNMPVKSAIVEFIDTPESGPNGEQVDVSVSKDGQQLTASWTLSFRSDGSYSRLYQIQCRTESGARDPMPIQYAITIRPDLPPEVSILEPVRDMDVPANTVVPLLIDARDPDFQLGAVNLHVKKNGQQVQKETLSSGQQQRLLAKHDLELKRLQVKPGDTVELWVQAFDNRQPRPNSKTTPELKLKIVDPISEKDAQQKLSEDKAKRDQTLKDEQEQNQDARPDQQPRADKSNDDRPRDEKDPQRRDQKPMPKQDGNQNGEQHPNPNGSAEKDGTSGSRNNNQGQSDKSKGGSQQQPSKGGTGSDRSNDQNKQPEQPLDPNGAEDDKALERLIGDELKRQQVQKQGRDNSQADNPLKNEQQDNKDNPGNENMPADQTGDDGDKTGSDLNNEKPKTGNGTPENKGKSPEKTGATSSNPKKPSEMEQASQPKETGAGEQTQKSTGNDNKQQPATDKTTPENKGTSSDKNQSPQPNPKKTPDAAQSPQPNETGGGQQPMPKADKSKGGENNQQQNPNEGSNQSNTKKPMPAQSGSSSSQNANDSPQNASNNDQPKEQGSGQNGSGDKNKKTEGSDKNGPTKSEGGKNEPGKNESGKPEEGAKPEAADKGAQPSAQEKNPEQGPAGADKPMPKTGPMPGAQGGNEKGGDGADKPANDAGDPSGTGETKPAKAPMPNGDGEQKPGEAGDGPEERIGSTPNAQKKKADGTETGTADADHDPNAKPTANSTNPDLKRDENQAPQVRPRDGKANDSNDPAKEASKNEVKPPTPQPGQPEKMKLDQNSSKTQDQPGNNPEKRQGDPNTANEEQNGQGKKEQRSKTGDGGQGGTSKEDPQGDPGSQQSGQGDATGRPGSQQPKPDKSNQTGGDKADGSGKPTSQQGEKKNGSKAQGKGSDDKSGNQPRASESQQSGGEGQGQGQESSQGGQPRKPGAPGNAEGTPGQGTGSGKPGRNTGKPGAGTSSAHGTGPAESQPNADRGPAAGNDAAPPEGEEANLEYKKQATELVLKRLQDTLERDGDDPELREKLGWTPEQLRKFSERVNKALQESNAAGDTPESQIRRQQFEEMLKSLNVNKSGTTRSGAQSPQREVNQIESRHSTVPKAYQKATESFSREITRQKKVDASQK